MRYHNSIPRGRNNNTTMWGLNISTVVMEIVIYNSLGHWAPAFLLGYLALGALLRGSCWGKHFIKWSNTIQYYTTKHIARKKLEGWISEWGGATSVFPLNFVLFSKSLDFCNSKKPFRKLPLNTLWNPLKYARCNPPIYKPPTLYNYVSYNFHT